MNENNAQSYAPVEVVPYGVAERDVARSGISALFGQKLLYWTFILIHLAIRRRRSMRSYYLLMSYVPPIFNYIYIYMYVSLEQYFSEEQASDCRIG